MVKRGLFSIFWVLMNMAVFVQRGVCAPESDPFMDVSRRYSLARMEIINKALDNAQQQAQQRPRALPQQTVLDVQKKETEPEFQKGVDDTTALYPSREDEAFRGELQQKRGKETPSAERWLTGGLQIMTGYRQGEFDWNIAGTIQGGSPNIISELTWSDIKMTQIKAKGNITLMNRLVIDGTAAYADIYSGDNQDSDYLGDDRTGEYSRSNNKSDDGEVMDLSGGVGYKLYLGPEPHLFEVDHLWLTLLGGYSYHEQNFVMTDGFQTIPATGPFDGLHSSYWAEWEGPWAGFELFGDRNKISGFFRFEYHLADYYGSANWNLRSDFQHPKSYEHTTDGQGFVFNMGGSYHITNFWSVDFNADFQDWETCKGIDRTFFSSGSIGETQLNEVNWQSQAFMLSSTYLF